MGTRILCFTDHDGMSGICTHHYSGEFEEGDCSTCSFPNTMNTPLSTFAYLRKNLSSILAVKT